MMLAGGVIISGMADMYEMSFRTLAEHTGAALWAMAVFACGFVLAFPVVQLRVRSLLVFPQWLLRVARKYLRPELSSILLFAFIFCFNTVAIFCYMVSGGLVFLPIVFGMLTGLNAGVVLLEDAREAAADPQPTAAAPARAWVGFCSLFVVVAELSSFWFAIGMGIRMGHLMRASFNWTTFEQALVPRALAYVLVIVPVLALSAAAETAAIKAMLRTEKGGAPGEGL